MNNNFYINKVKKLSKLTHSFSANYNYWFEYLMERVARLFEYNGLPFPQKELELRLLTNGYCAIVPYKNTFMACDCSMFGVTQYFDEFTNITWATPVNSGTHTIDKMHILCNNDSLRNSIIPIVNHYAVELAHCSVTLVDCLVNKRTDTVFTAQTSTGEESIQLFINDLYEGKHRPIKDEIFNSVKVNSFASSSVSFIECYELQKNILSSFFECFGIASPTLKKGNMTDDEVNRDNGLLLVNINDMLKSREEICAKLTDALGTKVTVKPLVNYTEKIEGVENGDNDN